jgi:peptide/nickel transport system substrate-binding protein
VAFAALSVGTAAGGTARAASIKPTLTVAVDSTDIDHSDPALSYSVLGWQIEQETCDTLVGYSDHSGKVSSSLSPLGAAGLPKVTNNGKTYTFTIRSGLKFSNGHSITAANYEYAFDRDALKSLNSPVTGFMTGVVKGWDTENNSNTIRTVSGVTAKGQKLTVTLVKADGTMLPKLALPFFCPIDKAAPLYVSGKWKGSEYSGALPGSGPYFLYKRTVGKQMVLHLNTHYKGLKLHKASTIIMNMKVSSSAAFNGIDAKNPTYALDLNGNPEPSNNKNLAKKYGVNKSRFWVEPTLIISYLAMNTSRNTFGHVNLRKAVNQVVDRPGILNIGGYLSGTSQTQALPKALAGSHWSSNYAYPTSTPTNARFSAAKSQGNNCNGGDTINFWHGTSDPAVQAAALDSYDFHQLGCNVNSVGFAGYDRYTQAGIKGNNMDIMTAGWSDDYPDGFDWFGILFDGRTIGPDNNNDLAYINNSTLNAKTDACSKLAGSARTNCWGAEDQWMTSNLAPWATENSANFVDYISDNAHNYRYDAPFASVELGLLYQS